METKKLNKLYDKMAEHASDGTGDYSEIYSEAREELLHLKKSASQLKKEYQRVSAEADELEARMLDMKISKRKYKSVSIPTNSVVDFNEKKLEHFARGLNFYKLLLILFIGSFAGVIIELLWCYARNGYFESRSGLVYGPFNLLYGVGAVALTGALYKYRNRGLILSFLGGLIVGSIVEYGCSWLQELAFGSRSWDYSAMPLNINGRICLRYSIFWGFLGVFWIKSLYPLMAKLILRIPNNSGKIITWTLTVFLAVNAVVTVIAIDRWAERINNEPSANAFESFVDKRFDDERMERIFANMEFGT